MTVGQLNIHGVYFINMIDTYLTSNINNVTVCINVLSFVIVLVCISCEETYKWPSGC